VHKSVSVIVVLAGLLVAVERFYHHPTYGNGLRAALSALQAGELFA
jgi:hypothetical protein